jgi:hypothetical protein
MGEEKQQVPPLRYATVGMTTLLYPQQANRETLQPSDRIVIPTVA